MEAMTDYKFADEDVVKVLRNGTGTYREIVLNEGALLIHKDDVVALAKEFDLVVFEKDAAL